MQTATAHIDYKTLHCLYEQSQHHNHTLQIQITELQHQLSQLQKLIFGSKHERFIPSNNNLSQQLSLNIQAQAVAQCSITAAQKIEYTRVKKEVKQNGIAHPGRHKLPGHLERREQIIGPAEDIKGLKKIGEEVTEELEYEPGKLFVNKIIRPKYAKAGNEGVAIAPMIDRPLPKVIVGAGLLAQIIIDKYVDHLPVYRQVERFKREGINIPHSTVGDWIKSGCTLIVPLYDAHKTVTLQSRYLHADETPLPVLDKDKKGDASTGSAHRGYYWVYNNSIERLVLFDYQPGRGREGPKEILKDFNGHLQTDGYIVYDFIKQKEGITVLYCMAHARRYFFDALQNDKDRAE